MKAFQAYGKAGKVTCGTAREAAQTYFQRFPQSRKCDVIEGSSAGPFFTVRYGRASEGDWPQSFKDVTKKTAGDLP